MRWAWRRCADSSRCLALARLAARVCLAPLARRWDCARVRARVTPESAEQDVDYGTLLDHLCGGGVETVDLSGTAGFGDGLCSAVASCVGRGLVRRVVDVSESGLSLAGLGALAGSLRTNETCGVVCHGLVDCKQLGDVAAAWGGQMEAGLLRRVDLGEVSGTRLSEDELVRLGHLLASQGLGSSVRVRVGVGGGGPGEGATAAVSAVAHAGVDVPVCDGWSWTSRELVGPVVTQPADGTRCDLSEVGMSECSWLAAAVWRLGLLGGP